jgi:hypothetical protein
MAYEVVQWRTGVDVKSVYQLGHRQASEGQGVQLVVPHRPNYSAKQGNGKCCGGKEPRRETTISHGSSDRGTSQFEPAEFNKK